MSSIFSKVTDIFRIKRAELMLEFQNRKLEAALLKVSGLCLGVGGSEGGGWKLGRHDDKDKLNSACWSDPICHLRRSPPRLACYSLLQPTTAHSTPEIGYASGAYRALSAPKTAGRYDRDAHLACSTCTNSSEPGNSSVWHNCARTNEEMVVLVRSRLARALDILTIRHLGRAFY